MPSSRQFKVITLGIVLTLLTDDVGWRLVLRIRAGPAAAARVDDRALAGHDEIGDVGCLSGPGVLHGYLDDDEVEPRDEMGIHVLHTR